MAARRLAAVEREPQLAANAAIGYGDALVLAAVFPDRAAALVRRGVEHGDSRRVCNVHWLSDVEAGQKVAAATFARLRSDPAFRDDLAKAQAEAKPRYPRPMRRRVRWRRRR